MWPIPEKRHILGILEQEPSEVRCRRPCELTNVIKRFCDNEGDTREVSKKVRHEFPKWFKIFLVRYAMKGTAQENDIAAHRRRPSELF